MNSILYTTFLLFFIVWEYNMEENLCEMPLESFLHFDSELVIAIPCQWSFQSL